MELVRHRFVEIAPSTLAGWFPNLAGHQNHLCGKVQASAWHVVVMLNKCC